MSSYKELSEQIVTCPYNEAHRIMRKRLQRHLVKCRESHPDVELVRCPFNSVHQIPEPELNHHVSICSDRAAIDQYRYSVAPVVKTEPTPITKQPKVNCDDDWDDVNAGTYNPVEYVKNAPIVKSKAIEKLVEKELFAAAEEDDEDVKCELPLKRPRKHLDDIKSDDDE